MRRNPAERLVQESDDQALPLFRCTGPRAKQHAGPFHAAAQSGALWKHESFAARALLPALKGRPPGNTVPYETKHMDRRPQSVHRSRLRRWLGLRRTRRGLVRGRLGLVANTGTAMGLFAFSMFLHIARAPAQYVTDVEQGVNQRGQHVSLGGLVAQRLVRDRCLGRPGRHPR